MGQQLVMSCPEGLITGVVLAGGEGSRMDGQDKGLIEWQGRAFTQYVLDILESRLDSILISANRNLPAYRQFGYPVIADEIENFAGPLAGMLSAMHHTKTPYILTVPCDVPHVTGALIERFCAAYAMNSGHMAYVAVTADGMQPVFALLNVGLAGDLEQFLAGGARKTSEWMQHIDAIEVDFSDLSDVFSNINTAQEFESLC